MTFSGRRGPVMEADDLILVSDSMWPTAPEELGAVFAANAVPDDEVRRITHGNAMRWYSFDPAPTCRRRRRRSAPSDGAPQGTTCPPCPAARGSERRTRSSKGSGDAP